MNEARAREIVAILSAMRTADEDEEYDQLRDSFVLFCGIQDSVVAISEIAVEAKAYLAGLEQGEERRKALVGLLAEAFKQHEKEPWILFENLDVFKALGKEKGG